MATTTGPKRMWWWAALAGIVSAGAFLATAELLALLVARDGSPILAVGAFVIDIVPQPFKEFAIATFGEYDKIALLVGLALAVVVAASISGILEYVRPPLGVVALGVAGALSVAAIVTRAGATPFAWVPPVVGTVVGRRRAHAPRPTAPRMAGRPRTARRRPRRASTGGPSSASRASPRHPPYWSGSAREWRPRPRRPSRRSAGHCSCPRRVRR